MHSIKSDYDALISSITRIFYPANHPSQQREISYFVYKEGTEEADQASYPAPLITNFIRSFISIMLQEHFCQAL